MGRYAFFNTGFEYKFAFATQDSEDILQFGGWFNNSWTENPTVKWSAAEEGPRILEKLRSIEHIQGYPECDFTAVSVDVDGTYALKKMLTQKVPDNTAYFRYLLGCIIYHQLLYTPVLVVHFEF